MLMVPSLGPSAIAVNRTASDWSEIGMPRGSVGIAICAKIAVKRMVVGTLRNRSVARSSDPERASDSGVEADWSLVIDR